MGWPMYGRKGVEEYTAVRLLSEFGKWVPGTGYTSNGSVHSAIRPPPGVFRQPELHAGELPVAPRPDKLYISTNILDSGDAHWYWQFYQRQVWSDPAWCRTDRLRYERHAPGCAAARGPVVL